MSTEDSKPEEESSFEWEKENSLEDWIKDWDTKDTWAHSDIYEYEYFPLLLLLTNSSL